MDPKTAAMDAEVARQAADAKYRHAEISARLGPMSDFVWPYVVRPLVESRERERKAWLRYVDAAIDDRDAQFAEEQEQEGAEAWRERTTKALDAAKQALVDLGVDFEMLGSEES